MMTDPEELTQRVKLLEKVFGNLVDMIEEIRDLHVPCIDPTMTYLVCDGCTDVHGWPEEWPCPTIQILDKER